MPAPTTSTASKSDPLPEVRERALSDFGAFVSLFWPIAEPADLQVSWHLRVLVSLLQDVGEGRRRKVAICVPPRHTKSLLASILWPAWLHARDPALRIMAASHSQALALDFGMRHREILRAPRFRRLFPWCAVKRGYDTKSKWETTRGGRRVSVGVGARVTGLGGRVQIIDDPHDLGDLDRKRARESVAAWYRGVWLNRRDDPTRSVELVIMQRSAIDDLVGQLADFGFETLAIPAIRREDAPPTDIPYDDPRSDGEALVPRQPASELEVLEREMGRHFHAVFQQNPRAALGTLFNRAWFRPPPPEYPADVVERVRYWDKAATRADSGRDPDWTVGALMARLSGSPPRFVLENIVRLRDTPGKTEARQVAVAELDARIGDVRTEEEQEPGSSGVESIHRRMEAMAGYAFSADRKTGPKEERWNALSVQAEAGNVSMVDGAWNDAWLAEAEVAPDGAHDDQLDAVSGAMARLRAPTRIML